MWLEFWCMKWIIWVYMGTQTEGNKAIEKLHSKDIRSIYCYIYYWHKEIYEAETSGAWRRDGKDEESTENSYRKTWWEETIWQT
jgi:hypothetical protein